MKPYRREEPRMTMSDQATGVDFVPDDGPTDSGEIQGDTAFDTIQALLFHPHLIPNVKILLMQLVWLDRELTADSLSTGSMLTPLQIQYALKESIDLGIATTRWVMVDENTGKTVRVFRAGPDVLGLLAKVPDPNAAVPGDSPEPESGEEKADA